jgi:Flp pilus assembly protein TadD
VGRLDEALLHFQKSVDLDPSRVSAQMNLGTALVRKGRFVEAIPHLEKSVQLSDGKEPAMLELLENAIRQAIAIAEMRNDTQLIERLQSRLAYYESRR